MKKHLLCFLFLIWAFAPIDWAVTDREAEALDEWFVLEQETALLKSEIESISQRVERTEKELLEVTSQIEKYKIERDEALEAYALLLNRRQKQGPYMVVEAIYTAENLSDFIKRLNYHSVMAKAVETLFNEIQETQTALEASTAALKSTASTLEVLKAQHVVEARRLTERKAALDALVYRYKDMPETTAYIEALWASWQSIPPLFKEKVASFNLLIENQVLPESIFDLNIEGGTLFATLIEARFNEALAGQSRVSDVRFDFQEDAVRVVFEGYETALEGQFVLEAPRVIVFEATHGYYKERLLSKVTCDHLLKEVQIRFDLDEMLGQSEIQALAHRDGQIELKIKIKLF